jgi:transcriptional regulator with GAF, ATPase, and Fis domain
MKKPKNIQYKFRRQLFDVDQYWNINYTEKYSNGSELDFKTFIKAKSYVLAKDTLSKRTAQEGLGIKIKAVHGFMFHKKYKNANNVRLRVKEWDQIRTASFPNENNVLYKLAIERAPEKTNRFNTTDYERIKSIGFKKGDENWSHVHNKGKVLALEDREGMIYKGKWVKWDKQVMKSTRQMIINALIHTDGNRSKAANHLGVSRHKFYCLMAKFPSTNWNKEYPVPKPFSNSKKVSSEVRSKSQKEVMKRKIAEGFKPFPLSKEADEKRRSKINETKRVRRQKRLGDLIPKIKKALSSNSNSRKDAAKDLGFKISYLRKIMSQTTSQVSWSKEYPTPSP